MVPDVRAAAAIIYNPETNEVLWESNSQDSRSIASITKVMTAVGHLRRQSGPDARSRDRTRRCEPREPHLSPRRRARHHRRPAAPHAGGFRQRRRARAGANLAAGHPGLREPHEREGARARPRAHDLRGLVRVALRQRLVGIRHGAAHRLCQQRRSCVLDHAQGAPHGAHQPARREHQQHEPVAGQRRRGRAGGKTGFITKAGYCLATLLRLPQTNQQVAVVVLGARSNAGRFMETRHLFNWLSSKSALNLLAPAPQPVAQPQE